MASQEMKNSISLYCSTFFRNKRRLISILDSNNEDIDQTVSRTFFRNKERMISILDNDSDEDINETDSHTFFRKKARLNSILHSDSDENINQTDSLGRTALHVEANNNYQEGVESLLERGADVNVQSYSGNTPLHEGIKSYKIVKTLLNKGALPNCRNRRGETPLFIAVRNKNIPVINLLLSVDANIELEDCKGYTPLHVAVSNYSRKIIKILLDHGANIEAKSKQGVTPLHISALKDDCLTTQFLLDMGANPNVTDELDESPTTGNTPLHVAANNEYSSVVEVLLDGGANPDIKNNSGSTPLHNSLSLRNFKSVLKLLKKGADVNLKETYQGNTPLHLAAKHNEYLMFPVTVDMFIRRGAIVDIINTEGNTALHEAANSMAPENVERLLQAGANPNAQNKKGETPLHLAARDLDLDIFSLEVIQLLLDWGASLKLANNQSKTVLDVARGEQLDLIKKHFVKLMPLNGSQFEVNGTIDLKGYESFHKSCLEELGLMKKKKCGKHSFFDIFYRFDNPYYVNAISMEKEVSSLRTEFPIYASMKELSSLRTEFPIDASMEKELSSLRTEFPIYASLLKGTFRKAKKRFSVMSKLVECFNVNCLPVEIKWKILTYLSDENLEYILKIVEKC